MSGFRIPESRQGNRHSLFVSRTFAGRQLATISVRQLKLIDPVSGTNIIIGAIHPANLVKNLKSVSSGRMRQEYADHLNQDFWKPYSRNRAYSCISVGGRANIQTLLKYIEDQESPESLDPSLTDH